MGIQNGAISRYVGYAGCRLSAGLISHAVRLYSRLAVETDDAGRVD